GGYGVRRVHGTSSRRVAPANAARLIVLFPRGGAMQVATTLCRAQIGLHAPLVHVEVHLGSGLPFFAIVGLPAAAVRESKQRVRAAIENCGFEFPSGRITVNLAPADLPKEGARFDLAIALGILQASGQIAPEPGTGRDAARRRELYGELSLSGAVKPVKGLLLAAAQASEARHDILIPRSNVGEARFALNEEAMLAVDHLLEACAALRGERLPPCAATAVARLAPSALDLQDVRGQYRGKRALIVAAAGSHSLLLSGPPGAGKTMLAQRLPGLLPALTRAEALEAAKVASASAEGFDSRRFGVRPFRAPHHTASAHAVIGGGPHAQPGEVSLAHRGILFLDELPEFDRRVLEALREPLESGAVAVSRAQAHAHYPAAFQLIAAMNPCACGYLGDEAAECRCTAGQIERYRARVSGPLLDRIDLHVSVARVAASELGAPAAAREGESTASAAAHVACARSRQLERAGKLNRDLTAAELGSVRLASGARALLEQAFEQLRLTARSFHGVLRVARTIADLEASEWIEPPHAAEAVQLRRGL
ncbi:MAG: YifB family Mg chelatase-like AAA ATPase, partial [Steroidobacteraceae bacterium]